MRALDLPFRPRLCGPAFGLVAALIIAFTPRTGASEAESRPAPQPVLPAHPLTLTECLTIALQQRPALVAARANLAAAQEQLRALEELGLPAKVLSPDLALRREQARWGVRGAQAGLAYEESIAAYVVKRTFFTVEYVRAQRRIIDEVVDHFQFIRDRVQKAVNTGVLKDWTEDTLDVTTVFLDAAKSRQIEAVNGLELALAALREALGNDPHCSVTVVEQPLPYPKPTAKRDAIVEAALAVRSELQQAAVAAAAAHLEVAAQGRAYGRLRVPTFAASADIHTQPVPTAQYDHRYRPAAIVVAMPTVLAGHRPNRVAIARALDVRTSAVADKARNLIALEATEAYLNWDTAARKLELLIDTNQTAARLMTRLGRQLRTPALGSALENVLSQMGLAQKARADYNEALFNYVLALADLERITGGVFDAGFISATTATTPPSQELPSLENSDRKRDGKPTIP